MAETWVYLQSQAVDLPGWWLRLDLDSPRFADWLEALKPDDILLTNVHDYEVCEGRQCIIHNPTEHHMSTWPLLWREDRAIFERICPEHGTGHPDPAQIPYWEETDQIWQAVHGCCGCCLDQLNSV